MTTPITILPDSRPQVVRNSWNRGALGYWRKIFCASCGADGGNVPESACTFAFYLCDPCAEAYGNIPGMVMQPDAAFWETVHLESLEKVGRDLLPLEQEALLADPESWLSRLARDRKLLTPKAGG